MNNNAFYRAYKGYSLWRKIVRDNKIDLTQDFILVIPSGEEDIAYYSIKYINKLIESFEISKSKKYYEGYFIIRRNECFYIVTDDKKIADGARDICRRVTKTVLIDQEKIRMVIESYCFFPYTDRMILGTVNHLQARGGIASLADIGISEEEIVANGIYHLNLDNFKNENVDSI